MSGTIIKKRKAIYKEKEVSLPAVARKEKEKARILFGRHSPCATIVVILFLVMTVLLFVLLQNQSSRLDIPSLLSPNAEITTRFPKFGTPEFRQQCQWALPPSSPSSSSCALYLTPNHGSNEGISWWVSKIAEMFTFGKLDGKNCRILLDYGRSVDLSEIVMPADTNTMDWRVPADYNWRADKRAQPLNVVEATHRRKRDGSSPPNHVDPSILDFRFAYSAIAHLWRHKQDYHVVKSKLGPSYSPEHGVACALNSLLELSPRATTYEPQLFTSILPTLHDPHNLVLALYMRTGRTDEVVRFEQNQTDSVNQETEKTHERRIRKFEQCASFVEERYRTSAQQNIVWLVVSDSLFLKQRMQQTHTNRTIVYTKSKGQHTKPNHHVDTTDFAEAFLDWWLIGESDVVVSDDLSTFGPTAALRTSRPLYRIANCKEPTILLHE